ncbi:MAG: hypothetical protein U5N85_08190 [Arcicella sp.]|nr:hypothetical protein [Arcicella sp.]
MVKSSIKTLITVLSTKFLYDATLKTIRIGLNQRVSLDAYAVL